jgi:hypothetical protein
MAAASETDGEGSDAHPPQAGNVLKLTHTHIYIHKGKVVLVLK